MFDRNQKDYDRLKRQYLMERDMGEMEKRIVKKLYLDCHTNDCAEEVANLLESKGFRYGYNGNPCERRAYHNMPYITVDLTNGFYSGSKGADCAVSWVKIGSRDYQQLFHKLPDIDAIQKKSAQTKNDAVDNNMRQPTPDGRKMERFWVTKTGRAMPISAMKDDHLHNTILMVDRVIAGGIDSIGGNRNLANMLDELEEERIHRGLHLPLIPFISLEYRKGNHNV